jgi:hypothetical protein
MTVSETIGPTISAKELAERKWIVTCRTEPRTGFAANVSDGIYTVRSLRMATYIGQ